MAIQTIFGKQYKSLSSSLNTFLQYPVTTSFVDPNTSLRALLPNTTYCPLLIPQAKFYIHIQ
jgi:hypothetical protein